MIGSFIFGWVAFTLDVRVWAIAHKLPLVNGERSQKIMLHLTIFPRSCYTSCYIMRHLYANRYVIKIREFTAVYHPSHISEFPEKSELVIISPIDLFIQLSHFMWERFRTRITDMIVAYFCDLIDNWSRTSMIIICGIYLRFKYVLAIIWKKL